MVVAPCEPTEHESRCWCCLLVAVLDVSGCFFGPPTPSKTRPNGPDWVSVKTTTELPDIVIERVTYRSGDLTIYGPGLPARGRRAVIRC